MPETRTCRKCAAENPADAQFCMACGTRLERSCQECGAPALPEARFCVACGAGLEVEQPGADAPLAVGEVAGAAGTSEVLPRAAPEASGEERRTVTVLFADLSGYTAIAERLDPEAVKALVDRCLGRLGEEVERHGG